MIFSKQISELKAALKTGETALAAEVAKVEAAIAEKVSLETRIKELETAAEGAISKVEHEAALALKDTKISELTAEVEKLTGQLEAAGQKVLAAAVDLEKKVQTKVVETIAGAGVPAAVRDPKAIDTPAKPSAGAGETSTQRLAAVTKIAGSSK